MDRARPDPGDGILHGIPMLRPYQEECLAASDRDIERGVRKQVIVIPTGGGKTRIAAERVRRSLKPKQQAWMLTHTDELSSQAYWAMKEWMPDKHVEVEKAEQYASKDDDIVIGSVQSMVKGMEISNRIRRFDVNRIRILIVDEAHHSTSQSYREIMRYFRCLKGDPESDPGKILIGITATPDRTDGVGLENQFDKLTYSKSIKELIREGLTVRGRLRPYLAPSIAWRVETEHDISDVQVRAGEYVNKQLSGAVNTPARNRLIVRTHLEYARELQGIVGTVDIQHSEDVAAMFEREGIPAFAISSRTSKHDRVMAKEAFERGELKILTSCQALLEGFDAPIATVYHGARPTKSGLVYRQGIGRVMRPCPAPEKLEYDWEKHGRWPEWVKDFCAIFDYVDNCGRHSPHTMASIYGLPPKWNLKGRRADEVADEFEELTSRHPNVDISNVEDIEDLKAQVDRIDLMRAPVVPQEIRRLSSLDWRQVVEGAYTLTLKESSLEVRVNAIGDYDLYQRENGTRQVVASGFDLKQALLYAEKLVPREEMILINTRARWRNDPPKEPQINYLHNLDETVRKAFPSRRDLFLFAQKEYENGNMLWSKGGVSSMIGQHLAAQEVEA